MMSNITVDGFCKMKHSLHNWWIKNSWTFSEIEGSHSLQRRLWKTVYFEREAVKSGRILLTLPKNLLPQSSRKKVVPSYREDAAAGCILRHMAYFWIATPFPLFIRFESQLLSALPRIKLHLKGQRSQGTDNVQQECDGGAEDYSGRMATSLD